jgi:hypothetical protein
MRTVIVQFAKIVSVEKWKDTVPKLARMTKMYYSSSKKWVQVES